MMSVRCLRSVASLTTVRSLSSWTSTRLGTLRRWSKSRLTWARARRSCLPSLPWAIPPHGRPALFGIVRGGGTEFAFEPRHIGAGRMDLLVQSAAMRIGDGVGGVLRLDLVIDERIEQELFSHVLEEVLLSPALEHAVGDLDVTEVPSARDHVGLMAAVTQARDLPQTQPAFEEAHGLIMQKIVNRASVEHGATADEAPLIDATAMALAIGEYVEAVLDHRGEQFRAKAAAVEHNSDLSLANHPPHLAKQTGHSLRQGRINLSGHHQQWVAGAVVDPVVGAGGHGQMAPRHVSI